MGGRFLCAAVLTFCAPSTRLWVMKTKEADLWVPITSIEPSPLFENRYSGNFAQNLELNPVVLGRFLSIASLDGRVLLTASTLRKPPATPDINPDGSVTGKGRLRWDEKTIETHPPKNYYCQVESDTQGWKVAINGDLIREELLDKSKDGIVRGIAPRFSERFDSYFKTGLKEALFRDKCTFTKDPFLMGRLVGTATILFMYYKLLTNPDFGTTAVVGINSLALYGGNFRFREEYEQELKNIRKYGRMSIFTSGLRYVCLYRRTVKSAVEGMAIPFELDRLVLGLGYLDWQEIRGKPLIRAKVS